MQGLRAVWAFLRRLDERLQSIEGSVYGPREPVSVAVAGHAVPDSERARSPKGRAGEPHDGSGASEASAAPGGRLAARGERAEGPAAAKRDQAEGAGSREPGFGA